MKDTVFLRRTRNDPARNEDASHKMEQMRRATGLGFRVPPTLISNDSRHWPGHFLVRSS